MKRWMVMLGLLCAGVVRCLSAAETNGSPEQLVSLYYEKIGKGDMAALADYMHGEELKKFRDMILPILEEGIKSGEDSEVLKGFTRGDPLEKVQQYSPKEFFRRFLAWITEINPGMTDILKNSTFIPIGHVADGDLIHVVFRMNTKIEGVTITKVSVMSLKKDGAEWKLLLTGEIEGMTKALQRQGKPRRKPVK
jgi:hypothetical protein